MENQIFYKENALPFPQKDVILSSRFQVEGKEIPWKLRALSQKENEKIGKKQGQTEQQYLTAVLAECVVFPDLKEVSLQDSYGVIGQEELLLRMLTTGEFAALEAAVEEINQ